MGSSGAFSEHYSLIFKRSTTATFWQSRLGASIVTPSHFASTCPVPVLRGTELPSHVFVSRHRTSCFQSPLPGSFSFAKAPHPPAAASYEHGLWQGDQLLDRQLERYLIPSLHTFVSLALAGLFYLDVMLKFGTRYLRGFPVGAPAGTHTCTGECTTTILTPPGRTWTPSTAGCFISVRDRDGCCCSLTK